MSSSVQENCSTKPSKKKTKNKRKQCIENGTGSNGHSTTQQTSDRLGEKFKENLHITNLSSSNSGKVKSEGKQQQQQQHNGTFIVTDSHNNQHHNQEQESETKSLTNGGPSSTENGHVHDEPRLNGDCNISKSSRNSKESNSYHSNGQKECHENEKIVDKEQEERNNEERKATTDGLSNGNSPQPDNSRTTPSPGPSKTQEGDCNSKKENDQHEDKEHQQQISPVTAQPAISLENIQIEYKEYESELQMHDIMRLIQAELSEPYSIYTYRYFIYNWPKLCFLAAHGNEYVGAIVCKLDMHMNVKRGYIAMLAVRQEYRKLKIGTTLVQKAIEAMLADNADEVVLETEMRNIPALRLYENLGFVRDKRLFRYYLNGVDALRLKLWFR